MSVNLVNYFEIIRLRAKVDRMHALQHLLFTRPWIPLLWFITKPLKKVFLHIKGSLKSSYISSDKHVGKKIGENDYRLSCVSELDNVWKIRILSDDKKDSSIDDYALNKYEINIISKNRKIIIIHAYYEKEAIYIFDLIKHYKDYDFVLTTSVRSIKDEFTARFNAQTSVCILVPNIGRDILPFLLVLKAIDISKYSHFVKVHTKRSVHRSDGSEWFKTNVDTLIGNRKITDEMILHIKETSPSIYGLDYLPLQDHYKQNKYWLTHLIGKPVRDIKSGFIPGTMFIGAGSFLKEVAACDLHLFQGEDELGQLDGCLPHALERYIGYLSDLSGGECGTIIELVSRGSEFYGSNKV